MRTHDEIQADVHRARDRKDPASLKGYAAELQALDTPQAMATASIALGMAAILTGDHPLALEHCGRALERYSQLGDRAGIARSTINIGNAYFSIGEYPSALEHYIRALVMYEEVGDHGGVAGVCGNMGILYSNTGDYPQAMEYCRRGLALYEELEDRGGIARVTGNMATVYQGTGDHASALEHYRRALTQHEELNDLAGVALVTGNMGVVYKRTGDHASALEYYRRALAVHEEKCDHAGVARVTGNMIVVLMTLGRYDEAVELLECQAAMRMDTPGVRASYQANCAFRAEHQGDLDATRRHVLEALSITTEAHLRAQSAEYHRWLRELAQKRNDFAGYIEHNNEYQRITEEIRGKEATQRMAMMEAERKMEGERRERDKERAILYSTLPGHVADRLVRGEDVSGDHFDHASVMFVDVVGFTTNTNDLAPRVVTELLDIMFNTFDELCAKHNVTKIKTIGDAYLAVRFPADDQSTEQHIASVALGIQQLMFTWPDQSPLQFRIGLHSGPVVAGVIGTQRLQYDVWGDTVNVASRMESTCEPGRIHVSEAFADVLRSSSDPAPYTLTQRGVVEIKGKGAMNTYWLEGA